MIRSSNICNVLKLDTHGRMNIVRTIHKFVSKLKRENIVTSANEIKNLCEKKNIFPENNVGGSIKQKNKLISPSLLPTLAKKRNLYH